MRKTAIQHSSYADSFAYREIINIYGYLNFVHSILFTCIVFAYREIINIYGYIKFAKK